MRLQPFVPGQLVLEFRAGLRVAVRRIEAGDDDAVDRRLDVAACLSASSPGSDLGSGPVRAAARMATPFQAAWPFHTAP